MSLQKPVRRLALCQLWKWQAFLTARLDKGFLCNTAFHRLISEPSRGKRKLSYGRCHIFYLSRLTTMQLTLFTTIQLTLFRSWKPQSISINEKKIIFIAVTEYIQKIDPTGLHRNNYIFSDSHSKHVLISYKNGLLLKFFGDFES